MMRFFDPTLNSMSVVMRRVDLILLSLAITMYLVNKYVLGMESNNLYFAIFCGVFLLLSFTTPLHRSTIARELYAMASMLIMVVADIFDCAGILFYWNVIRLSTFLPLRSVTIIILMSGVFYSAGLAMNYENILAKTTQNGVAVSISTQSLVLIHLSSYIGFSALCVLLSRLYALEQRSRLRAEVLTQEMEVLAIELERKRISRDIHDGLGHTLTTLDIQLELAQKLRVRDPQQALAAIDQAKILTTQCLQDVRLALHNIRQEPFDLHQALLVLTDRLRPSLNIHVQLDLPGLPVQPSHQLYCILQEGLTNIQKHAGAKEVFLRGWYDGDNLWVQLKDDGRGFESAKVSQGFGLRSMSERAQLLGGHLTVLSNQTQGTCLDISIPLVAK
jgi:signal transduction histidine kinase